MNLRKAKASPGGTWAADAFPPESRQNFDEVDPARVLERSKELAAAMAGEEWEVVDGIGFPYDRCA